MEWGKSSTSTCNNINCSETEGMLEGGLFVKVMTDEQMEILRRQISVYATISEQLFEMHKSITANQDNLAGMRLGSLYCDPLMLSGGVLKITARQRWTPTPMQLQILENIFEQGNGTPSKQKVKEITSELSQHGQISETNVYNWFQNRRARSKRRQTTTMKSESEVEAEMGSPDEKKTKFEKKTNSFPSPEVSSEMHSIDPGASGSLGQMSLYDDSLSNRRMDHLLGKMEISERGLVLFGQEQAEI